MNLFRRSLSVYLLFIAIGLSITVSCNKLRDDDLNCGPFHPAICSQLDSIGLVLINSNSGNEIPEYGDVNYNGFKLQVRLFHTEVNCVKVRYDKNIFTNPFINTAYACTPPQNYLDFQGSVQDVQILADKDYGDIKAGSNLRHLDKNNQVRDVNVSYSGDWHNNDLHWFHEYTIRADSPLAKTDTFKFTVRYIMNDSRVLESSRNVVLQK